MRLAGLGVVALIVALAAGCASSAPCQNLVHAACDDDGGPYCPTNSVCVGVGDAIDPCATGASACCFQACMVDKDCPSAQSCVSTGSGSICALGLCDADGGTSG